MVEPIVYNRNFSKWFAKDVLRAIKKYHMIREGDTVHVALSGGKDSMTLLYILSYLRQFSYLQFELEALHVKTTDYDTTVMQAYCRNLGVPYLEAVLRKGPDPEEDQPCYICSRLKRGALSELLKQQRESRVAYGHHADDAAETFLMNMIQNRKLGSFSPRVSVAGHPMVIIRPMIYLAEETIRRLHAYASLPLLDYRCPHEATGLRKEFKERVAGLDAYFNTTGFSRRVVDAIENIDRTNIWSDVE
ncbi:MAG: tRNA 2-thiocytidine biosynthesis protein TtcA [Deltaproteobacteria bacterium]|jgi:tRNA 2-thiocytidine biosynthesis protein TtcA|nr:tRNA 2-thiocytidine biosynthesis protein TtcA [Deltaproteobacteria bacterium]MBT4638012.1 tRNA 2-thiocytidine biosynthesis protein TtcA [Deltaproteobacteria bacterium]MBT6501062.1 tRNA 2-thiocytidine biosynthesis protein TtcA [Deltaproteobacteria bacterium]MBT7155955.1 tRNA 2-thiocytidine biosynthesis protein TtcA [Deltaproteobacteria bacterium]MBT7715438.1 tRNA 2-thiocytidine biosynthesis protein TtcA [Deltaproteobacteria bacterium]